MFNYPGEYVQLPWGVCSTTLVSMFNYPGEFVQHNFARNMEGTQMERGERGWNADGTRIGEDGTRMERGLARMECGWNADWQGRDIDGTVMERGWNVDPKKETISGTFEGPIRITLTRPSIHPSIWRPACCPRARAKQVLGQIE